MADTRDWVHVIKGRVSIKRWLEDRKKTRCYLLYNEKDKKPFFTFIKRKIFKY